MDMTSEQLLRPPVRQTSKRATRAWKTFWKFHPFYVMLLPGIIWYAIYQYWPMFGAIIAFKDYNLRAGMLASPWADPWYKYFQIFFESPYFTQLLANTTLISLYKIVFGMVPPIVLALLLNESRTGWYKRLIQTLSYAPHFLSWVIIYGIFFALFSQSTGIVNRWLAELTGETVPFLTSPDWFRSVLVASSIWKDLGWGAIIYLAAIVGIDPSLYEAATVDGASRLQRMRHITFPGIRSVIILLLLLRLGQILSVGFEQVFVFYNIQVYSTGDIIDTWVYRTGLEQLNFSLAAAVGLFKSLIGLVLVLGANRVAKRWGENLW
jgi:putative aldouronate transport system permease protein